jgi:hypothetical protein
MTNKYAVIENSLVVNTTVSDAEFAQSQGWIACPDDVGIGWSYVNGQFVDNRPNPPEPEPAPAPTKEELMAELAALTAKIQALE